MAVEHELRDVAIWWKENKDRIPRGDLAKRCEFLETCVHNLLNIHIATVEELQSKRGKSASLWLPNGISVSGDVRKFG